MDQSRRNLVEEVAALDSMLADPQHIQGNAPSRAALRLLAGDRPLAP